MLHDDDPLCGSVLAILRGLGFHTIDQVTTARAAMEIAACTQLDAIVMDVDLVGDRGLQLVSTLHRAGNRTPIVLLSQFEGVRFAALEAGAHAYVGKADPRQLRRCLTRLLRLD